jgi:hypothetical protein
MNEFLDIVVRFKHRNDRSTVAIVSWDDGALIGTGHSKLQPGDYYNQEIGEQIALGRALMDLGLKEQNRWILRSRTEAEVKAQRVNRKVKVDADTAFGDAFKIYNVSMKPSNLSFNFIDKEIELLKQEEVNRRDAVRPKQKKAKQSR